MSAPLTRVSTGNFANSAADTSSDISCSPSASGVDVVSEDSDVSLGDGVVSGAAVCVGETVVSDVVTEGAGISFDPVFSPEHPVRKKALAASAATAFLPSILDKDFSGLCRPMRICSLPALLGHY